MACQQDLQSLAPALSKVLGTKQGPQIILLLCGKRKCGKDFVTDYLKSTLGEDECEILKISQPIKSHWAKQNNLNLNELLSDSQYKEQYRLDMIKWSEEVRKQDYGCFCRSACQQAAVKRVWIVSDIRRKTDIQWFKENYGDLIKIIRIVADDKTRMERGYQFMKGVDDAASECDLDDYAAWDLVVENSKGNSLKEQLDTIINSLCSEKSEKSN